MPKIEILYIVDFVNMVNLVEVELFCFGWIKVRRDVKC
jgi:hypothetical protein